MAECDEIQDYMKELTGGRTESLKSFQISKSFESNNDFGLQVPRVFINGRFVGGARKIRIFHRTGLLRRMLRRAKAIP